ncbi:hypothetical protein [Palleronia caenipelagi]|uniref:Uncharacterized protein n=1 Tax=Palleronia caenipelagi TaxID=2489174 RepID=A0A547PJH7_9RHOB|nr:hypothetical protein [Palleronia caenipelagi]TRD14315.1 hypothetical protein FEV53_19205 [Palleronia caenipelagi]
MRLPGFADDFYARPLAWAGNQAGHYLIGAYAAAATGWSPGLLVALYIALIESWQIARSPGNIRLLRDSAEDTGFVALGAFDLILWTAAPLALGGAIRAWQRRKEG